MSTPDPHTSGTLIDAIKYGGGGVLSAVLLAFAKNFFTSDGKDAREMRGELREEIKRLRELREQDEDERQELRDDLGALRGARDELRVQLMRANTQGRQFGALLNEYQQHAGAPLTPWPEQSVGKYTDPDEPRGGP